MADRNFKEKLNEAAMEVFGTMYFTPLELLEEAPEAGEWNLTDDYVKAEIGFSGPMAGKVHFYFPGPLSRTITEGFLGLDTEQLNDQQIVDTMGEAANMIIGGLLGRIDPEGACSLGIPASSLVQDFSPDRIEAAEDQAVFFTDFGFLWVYIFS